MPEFTHNGSASFTFWYFCLPYYGRCLPPAPGGELAEYRVNWSDSLPQRFQPGEHTTDKCIRSNVFWTWEGADLWLDYCEGLER